MAWNEDVFREDFQQVTAFTDKMRAGLTRSGLVPSTPAQVGSELEAQRIEIDRYRLEVARLRAIVTRVIEIPREPHASEQEGELGRAYTRGWESVIALIDKALLPEEED